MKRKIIAFYSPYPAAGKTLAARYIELGSPFLVYSFTGDLRISLLSCLRRMAPKNIWFYQLKDLLDSEPVPLWHNATVREALMYFRLAGQKIYPDFWIDIMRSIIDNAVGYIAIDDLHFPNEYEILKSLGAKFVRITNPDRKIIKSDTEGLLEDYGFDYQLVNDKSKPQKYYSVQIDEMMSRLWPEE